MPAPSPPPGKVTVTRVFSDWGSQSQSVACEFFPKVPFLGGQVFAKHRNPHFFVVTRATDRLFQLTAPRQKRYHPGVIGLPLPLARFFRCFMSSLPLPYR
jgi:hypothetical protein